MATVLETEHLSQKCWIGGGHFWNVEKLFGKGFLLLQRIFAGYRLGLKVKV